MILEKDNLYSIKKEIKKISRDLWLLRQRLEFQYEMIESHFLLETEAQCLDCLNKLLYLLNREINSRKRRWQKTQTHRSMMKDWQFFQNIPLD